tara:strand:+ start:2239 stop:2472 length:234 start_codon:yes stop_codon:yes gene_type:complete
VFSFEEYYMLFIVVPRNRVFMKKPENGTKKSEKPWPTIAAMEQVSEMNLWGTNKSDFYSGLGSHDPEIVNPYVEVLK